MGSRGTTRARISTERDRSATAANRASGDTLRTYRLAVAATGEYTQYHGGTVPLGLAAMVTAISRVNGIYERGGWSSVVR